jgi:hypothetical protein
VVMLWYINDDDHNEPDRGIGRKVRMGCRQGHLSTLESHKAHSCLRMRPAAIIRDTPMIAAPTIRPTAITVAASSMSPFMLIQADCPKILPTG